MKKYEEPEFKVTRFDAETVCALGNSGDAGQGDDVPGDQPGIVW